MKVLDKISLKTINIKPMFITIPTKQTKTRLLNILNSGIIRMHGIKRMAKIIAKIEYIFS